MSNPFYGQDADEPVVIRDRRRIDPQSGDVRDEGSGRSPFPGAAGAGNPADPKEAGQTISATLADSEQVAGLKAELADRTAHLQRLNAEYANYRKRTNRDLEAAAVAARASFAGELLAVLDDVDLARQHGDLNGAFKSVADRLVGILEKQGLQGFGNEGDAFDPAHHEAVHFATSPDVATPTVSSVLRRGYAFKERPLRPAVVAVTGPEHEGVAVSTPDTGAAADADDADRQADAEMRSEQESKQSTAPHLDDEGAGTAGSPPRQEDPA